MDGRVIGGRREYSLTGRRVGPTRIAEGGAMSGEGMSGKPVDHRPRPGGGLRARIATLLVLVATCGAVFWAARVVRDVTVPANGLVRMLRDGEVRDRLAAARALGESTPE